MSLMSNVLLLITLAGIVPAFPFNSFKNCKTDLECSSNLCCLLGPTRYAIPTCMPFQQKGEQCRVNADTITANLTYPNNLQLEIRNANFILCPCANGLFCERGICN
ncbi:astakine-like [Camponotus floridanus]|uniref:astakine-like n=1 Tax=Camponotus floridanus TaxID=104421 RepID=UPI00059ECC71|nr:astakine-like [Camponotus floridanus]